MLWSKFRRFLSTWWGMVFLFSFLAFTSVFAIAVVSVDPPDASDEYNETEIEDLVLEYVNEERASNGQPPFSEHAKATEAARGHANNMAENDFYNHTSPAGETQQERYSFCDGGENIHQTWVDTSLETEDGEIVKLTSEQEVAERIFQAWMNSEPHRENGIYGEWWTSAGTGISISDDDEVYAVLGFCSE